MGKLIGKTLLVAFSVLLAFSLSVAIEKKPPTVIETDKVPSAIQAPKCPDLKARLTLTKTKSGFTGTIHLRGQVCNIGNTDYISPPLASARAELAGYDPEKPLTGDNYKIIASKAINNLPRGACTSIAGTYIIEHLIGWGHTTNPDGKKPGIWSEREFSLHIGRNVPDDINFKQNEDCNKTNNLVKERVPFMVVDEIIYPPRF